ncbi:MAG: AraC family transcriptional regulator [Lachnospiraceae bacterium]|nr:AraC family transcriptional regulator [Lachnospiraceae bacterium]
MYKVLFAEDEAIMRKAFHQMLDWDSTEFDLAAVVSNGQEALSYLVENHVDIVITDLLMPVMTGIELIQALKARDFNGIIIVLSNYADFNLVRQALTQGASDYVLKLDIDGDVLLTHLNTAAAQLRNGDIDYLKELEKYKSCKKEVLDVLRYLNLHYTEKLSLDDIANAVNLNRSYICRIFKQETGQSMFNYLNDLRMKKAGEIIEEGNVYIREVAALVGFDDPFYFARVFKKYYQVTPTEYRREKI